MRRALFILLAFLWFSAVNAAEVYIRDGSVVIGTIKRMVDGEDLIVDTEYMGDVTIEWDALVEIRSTEVVEVELFDGSRVYGELTLNEEGLTVIGEDTRTVQLEDVFGIDEFNETLWEGLDVYTDLGMNIVRGNNQVTQLSFGGGVTYNGLDFETTIDGTVIVNEQASGEDTRRQTLGASYLYKLGKRWFAAGLYQFESDEQQNLRGRSLLGGALGNRVVNRRKQRLDLYAGLAVNSEEFEGQSRSETLEGLLGAAYRFRSAVDIDASWTVLPSLEQSDRVRSQFDGSLSFDLFSDFDFKVTVYDRYDSQPPAGNDKNDTGLTLGLSWSR